MLTITTRTQDLDSLALRWTSPRTTTISLVTSTVDKTPLSPYSSKLSTMILPRLYQAGDTTVQAHSTSST